jgi:hypothetical protein
MEMLTVRASDAGKYRGAGESLIILIRERSGLCGSNCLAVAKIDFLKLTGGTTIL